MRYIRAFGFPLDDIWHRIFGQDVTLWGPTHLMMIGGAGLSLFSVLMLEYEGGRALPDAPPEKPFVRFLRYLSCGGLLIGLSVYQIEYDFGVQQFRLAFHPMMIAGVASLGLVVARMTLGKGAAIIAALFAIALRGAVAFTVGPVLGAPSTGSPVSRARADRRATGADSVVQTPDGLRRRYGPAGRDHRPLAGIAVDRGGLPLPWPTSMWGEGLAMAVPVAVLMGLCGALTGMVLTGQPLPRRAIGISIVAATVVVIGARSRTVCTS